MIKSEITLMTIYEYSKLSNPEKLNMLKGSALFIDTFNTNNKVYVYFLNGFFVEVIEKEGRVTDIIPYKRGYKQNKKVGEKEFAYEIA